MINDDKGLAGGPAWIPLPNFGLKFPLASANEKSFKAVVKSMASLMALGVRDVFSAASSEIQFVMLCKLTSENGDMAFNAYMPYPRIVEFACNHLPPRMQGERLRAAIASTDVVIEHRYALIIGPLIPLVVVYEPTLKNILLTNQNHFTNPRQFLDPRICVTTSGFLSFLGTFTLESSKFSVDRPHISMFDDVQNLTNKGLEQWLHWFSQLSKDGKWETSRIYVNSQYPEQYIYSYD